MDGGFKVRALPLGHDSGGHKVRSRGFSTMCHLFLQCRAGALWTVGFKLRTSAGT